MSIIGIVGAGHLGLVLAKRLVALGHQVRVANSRGPDSLTAFARETGAYPVSLSDVAQGAEMLILAVPLSAVPVLSQRLAPSLRDTLIVIDAGNYVPVRDGRIDAIDAGMPESGWVAQMLDWPVVKAFNSVTEVTLLTGGRDSGAAGRIALPVAADDASDRAEVMRLVEQLGFTAWDAGPLAASWRQQIGQPAYCTDGSVTELPRLLAQARLETVAANRESAMALMQQLPPDLSKRTLVRTARLMAGLDRGKPTSWFAVLRLVGAMARHRAGQALRSLNIGMVRPRMACRGAS